MEIDPLGLPNGQSVSLTTGAAMTAFENRYIFGEIVEGNPEEAVWNQIGPHYCPSDCDAGRRNGPLEVRSRQPPSIRGRARHVLRRCLQILGQ